MQAAATREQIVVAAELTRQATDMHEMQPMVEAANHNLGTLDQTPVGVLLADAGYYSDANARALPRPGPNCCSPVAATATGAPPARRYEDASRPRSRPANGCGAS